MFHALLSAWHLQQKAVTFWTLREKLIWILHAAVNSRYITLLLYTPEYLKICRFVQERATPPRRVTDREAVKGAEQEACYVCCVCRVRSTWCHVHWTREINTFVVADNLHDVDLFPIFWALAAAATVSVCLLDNLQWLWVAVVTINAEMIRFQAKCSQISHFCFFLWRLFIWNQHCLF